MRLNCSGEKKVKKVPKRFGHVRNSPYLCTRFREGTASRGKKNLNREAFKIETLDNEIEGV